MTKDALMGLHSQYTAKARRATEKWKETGERKYERDASKNYELAEVMQIALNASDNHEFMLLLVNTVINWAVDIRRGKDVTNNIIEFATQHNLL